MIITKTIPLPKTARAKWENQEVVMNVTADAIIIKRIEPPSWDELLPKLRKAGKQISRRALQEAIVFARKR